jgi:MATE family multidrug resistance protein
MRESWRNLREEIGPMLKLAGPLVLAEVGWVAMGMVDTAMVGRLPNGTEAIAASSLGNVLFYAVGIFGGGMLLGLDTLVSQAFGAGKIDDCHRSLLNAIYMILIGTPPLMLLALSLLPVLYASGIPAHILHITEPYLRALLWSAPPLMFYFAFRRYLQGMNFVKPVAMALITANLVNVFLNWVLIYGHLGAPSMGVEGSAWATVIARVFMAGVLLLAIVHYEHKHKMGLRAVSFKPDFARIRRLLALGIPASTQITLEIGLFATCTALAGRLGAVALASHQIALHMASLAFMFPLGISAAAAVRVGQALGRRDALGAGRAGWTAIALGFGVMICTGVLFLLMPAKIVRIYSLDPEVVETGVLLLTMAALFQLFDGVQGVAVGALRGAGDTRTPMLGHLICDWAVGLPLGYWLCFALGWGAAGLWVGLSTAMILVGIVLLVVWRKKVHGFLIPH